MMNNKLIKEILIILIVSFALGLIYNYSLPKPIPLVYKKTELKQYSDDILFGNSKLEADKNINIDNDSKTVTYEQMLKIIESDEFILIDARSPEMYSKSTIGKAINIFPYSDESEVMSKILDLPTDKKIIVFCDGGNCDSSHKIADILHNFGYINSYIYSGGWDEWSKIQGIK